MDRYDVHRENDDSYQWEGFASWLVT